MIPVPLRLRCTSFFFQAEDGIRDYKVTGVQTCALPICGGGSADTEEVGARKAACKNAPDFALRSPSHAPDLVVYRPIALPPEPVEDLLRSEEHTSELQSPCNLVCRLLLEKKKNMLHTVL